MLKAERERRTSHDADLERIYAEDGFPFWLQHVVTEWEEAPGRTELAAYPDYEFLNAYRATYQINPYSACDKSRGMLASTDPLLWDFWNCQRIAYQNRVHSAGLAQWRAAVQRQSQADSNSLLKRAFDVYSRLPDWVRQPLGNCRLDLLETEHGGIVKAFHAGPTAGRGDAWDHLNIDEMAFQQQARENWQAFDRVRLKQGTSTPNGRDNLFAELTHGLVPGVEVVHLHYSLHPDRRPGTPVGDAWYARKRAGKTEVEWQIEYEINYDVYRQAGFYTADWSPDIVRPVQWDGRGIITIGMDYSYLNPAAVWLYLNGDGQLCRLGCELRHEIPLEKYCAELFDRLKTAYPSAAFRIAPDPFRGGQHKGDSDAYGGPSTDVQVIQRVANNVFARPVLVSVSRTGRLLRKEGHREVRRTLLRRADGLYASVVDPSCTQLIQGFAGAYGPAENANPHAIDLESPDERRECVHVMDADRYAVCEFMLKDEGPVYGAKQPDGRPVVSSNPTMRALRQRREMV